jgi:hypothetical protein
MKLHIDADTTIRELNKILQLHFPFLNFGFFRVDQNNPVFTMKGRLPEYTELIDVNGVMREGIFDLSGDMKVCDVERYFWKNFHLPVRIYRRFNLSWILADMESQLPLEMVNHMGASSHYEMQEYELL